MSTLLNPLHLTQELSETYIQYLLELFAFRDEETRKQFRNAITRPGWLLKGPLLESTPPFRTSATVAELMASGRLSGEFEHLDAALPGDRQLFSHQVAAIEAARADRNIVVATGTGSGKTESFLLPILDALFREREAGTLDRPGVRALLLYPMNALVNDQLRRLREYLRDYPEITFGRFTGDTAEKDDKAESEFRKEFGEDAPRLPNELISRTAQRKRPPHLLITNYSMLEYLLLRPDDVDFFDHPEFGQHWRFFVVDEAHLYQGALGAELSYLLRRLKARVAPERGIQCFATSATVGDDSAKPAVATFASTLFDVPVESVEVITGDRRDLAAAQQVVHRLPDEFFGTVAVYWSAYLAGEIPPASLLDKLVTLSLELGLDVTELRADVLVPEEADLVPAGDELDFFSDSGAPGIASGPEHIEASVARWLYQVLAGEERIRILRERLKEKPLSWLKDLSEGLFELGSPEACMEALHHLVTLSLQARPHPSEAPVLPARYHLFARALEGGFVAPALWGRPETPALSLERQEHVEHEGQRLPVYELLSCKRCGQGVLEGAVKEGKDGRLARLMPKSEIPFWASHTQNRALLLWPPLREEQEESGVEWSDEENDLAKPSWARSRWATMRFCPLCGSFSTTEGDAPLCACDCKPLVTRYLETSDDETNCYRCNQRQTLISLNAGQDAPGAVLTTVLYGHLPPDPTKPYLPGGGRKLLCFSDSRQQAAQFAPYMQGTYNNLLRRRVLFEAMATLKPGKGFSPEAWSMKVHEILDDEKLFPEVRDEFERASISRQWVWAELLDRVPERTLFGLGLAGLELLPVNPFEESLWTKMAAAFSQRHGLQDPEWKTPARWKALWQMLLQTLPSDGVVDYNGRLSHSPREGVEWSWLDFSFAHHKRAVDLNEGDKQRPIGWLPSATRKNQVNARLAIVQKFTGLDVERARALLQELFDSWGARRDRLTYFIKSEGHYMLSAEPSAWRIFHPERIHRCRTCDRFTAWAIDDRCPRGRCEGRLVTLDLEENTGHYAELARGMRMIGLRSEEHTAQLTSDTAASVQGEFQAGAVNLLSCSTTFELGVDLGDLQAVFMRNVPPQTANYLQRAGRSGRRGFHVPVVLTYAQKRSHDLYYFRSPERLVDPAEVKPPRISLPLKKVRDRHRNALVLGRFFQAKRDRAANLKDFYRPVKEGLSYSSDLLQVLGSWLYGERETLERLIAETFGEPPEANWIEALLSEGSEANEDDRSNLIKATEELLRRLGEYEEAIQEADKGAGDAKTRRRATMLREEQEQLLKPPVIRYLSSRGVIPTYGFPVDTVPLRLRAGNQTDERLASTIELTRDLKLALAEYAPGNEIVARGRIWRSGGLLKWQNWTWPSRSFQACPCGWYDAKVRESQDATSLCPKCRQPIKLSRDSFRIPSLGFTTRRSEKSKGMSGQRLARSFTSRKYFRGYGAEDRIPDWQSRPGEASVTRVAVRGPREGQLVLLNTGFQDKGFRLCETCGWAEAVGNPYNTEFHHNPSSGRKCEAKTTETFLGHEYLTDLVELAFHGMDWQPYAGDEALLMSQQTRQGFWLSLLYALLEGLSRTLQIPRNDVDGCLYWGESNAYPHLVLFDTAPGGAGYVRQLADDSGVLKAVIEAALSVVSGCACDVEGSCYACLRDFRNQQDHPLLRRDVVLTYLERLVGLLTPDACLDVGNGRSWLLRQATASQGVYLDIECIDPAPIGESGVGVTRSDWFDDILRLCRLQVPVSLRIGTWKQAAGLLDIEALRWQHEVKHLLSRGVKLYRRAPGKPDPGSCVLDAGTVVRLRTPGGGPLDFGGGELGRLWRRDAGELSVQDWEASWKTASIPVLDGDALLEPPPRGEMRALQDHEPLYLQEMLDPWFRGAWKRITVVDPFLSKGYSFASLQALLDVCLPYAAPEATIQAFTRSAQPKNDFDDLGRQRVQQEQAMNAEAMIQALPVRAAFGIFDDPQKRLHDRWIEIERMDGSVDLFTIGRGVDFIYWRYKVPEARACVLAFYRKVDPGALPSMPSLKLARWIGSSEARLPPRTQS